MFPLQSPNKMGETIFFLIFYLMRCKLPAHAANNLWSSVQNANVEPLAKVKNFRHLRLSKHEALSNCSRNTHETISGYKNEKASTNSVTWWL